MPARRICTGKEHTAQPFGYQTPIGVSRALWRGVCQPLSPSGKSPRLNPRFDKQVITYVVCVTYSRYGDVVSSSFRGAKSHRISIPSVFLQLFGMTKRWFPILRPRQIVKNGFIPFSCFLKSVPCFLRRSPLFS
jgi:hypothetical protein